MAAYPSLTSMNPPAQDAMDTFMSRQLSDGQSPQEDHDFNDSLNRFYKMTAKPRGTNLTLEPKLHVLSKYLVRLHLYKFLWNRM